MAFNMDYEQTEKLDRLSERLGVPKSALVRDAVNKLFDLYAKELGEEGADERAGPDDLGPER
jgi:predicted DNA-binding protein